MIAKAAVQNSISKIAIEKQSGQETNEDRGRTAVVLPLNWPNMHYIYSHFMALNEKGPTIKISDNIAS